MPRSVSTDRPGILERLAVSRSRMYRLFTVAFGKNMGEERAGKAAPHKGLSVEQIKKLPYGSRLLTGLEKAKTIARKSSGIGDCVLLQIGDDYEIWPQAAFNSYKEGKMPYGDLGEPIAIGPHRLLMSQHRQLMVAVAPELAIA